VNLSVLHIVTLLVLLLACSYAGILNYNLEKKFLFLLVNCVAVFILLLISFLGIMG